ncbi:ZNF3 protein, partial [Atrichornis clamosus]|nr:ZNF3 protein [Atrichornis clamosus]
LHTGEQPYECLDCRKSFNCSSFLIILWQIHTGERPYEYPKCGKRFQTSLDLIRHQQMHTREPFHCTNCRRGFNCSSTLLTHGRIHI